MITENKPLILVIDFANVAYAGWYTKPEIGNAGFNVNAIFIFFQRLKSLKDTFDPTYLILAEDLGRTKTFRRQMYPPYKAQRKPLDPDIGKQMEIIKAISSQLGLARISNEIYEADDIAGMIAHWGDDNGFLTIIVSSDRDLYQLVTDNTSILSPRDNTIISPEFLMNEYGLTSKQWIELKILQGDTSDNIPGIRGIGKKTALDLMQKYGSIENIYNHLDDLKPHFKTALINGKGDIPLTRDLVTIINDYNLINLTEDMLYRTSPIYSEVEYSLKTYGLTSLYNVMKYGLYPHQYESLEVLK